MAALYFKLFIKVNAIGSILYFYNKILCFNKEWNFPTVIGLILYDDLLNFCGLKSHIF